MIDRATATNYRFTVGDRVLINLPDRPQTFTITGIVTFGCDDNLAGITLAGFSLPTAQAGFNARGSFDTISVLAAPGADTVRLQRAIAAMLPPGVELISGRALVNELSNAVDSELSFISTALLVFGFIALFVGAFTIFNTFSITVGQRTRELALLGVVGASRRQVFRSVLSEAAVTALVASLIGLGLGVLAALGLKALLKAFNIVLPSSPLVFEARTPVVAITVGVGVTVISALSSMLGTPGRLAQENATRNPRRTAQTAAALMVSLALVSTIAVLGTSLSESAANSVDTAINANYIISGNGGFSKSVVPAVSHVPGVTTTTTVYQGQFEFRSALSTLTSVSTAHLSQTIKLHLIDGSGARALAAGQLLIDSTIARSDNLHVGSVGQQVCGRAVRG